MAFSFNKRDSMLHYKLYTDGSFSQKNNIGGWAFDMRTHGDEPPKGTIPHIKQSGYKINSNIHEMELLPIVKALSLVPNHIPIVIYSDNKGIINEINSLINGKTKIKRKNCSSCNDLWNTLAQLLTRKHVTANWVKAHSGIKINEMVNIEAQLQVQQQQDCQKKRIKRQCPKKTHPHPTLIRLRLTTAYPLLTLIR